MQMGGDTTTGFAMRGFGLSDVLLATKISNPATPKRWGDFDADSLGDTPPGIYVMTLRITDRISGRATSRVMSLVVGEK
jgi:hypothetical protein